MFFNLYTFNYTFEKKNTLLIVHIMNLVNIRRVKGLSTFLSFSNDCYNIQFSTYVTVILNSNGVLNRQRIYFIFFNFISSYFSVIKQFALPSRNIIYWRRGHYKSSHRFLIVKNVIRNIRQTLLLIYCNPRNKYETINRIIIFSWLFILYYIIRTIVVLKIMYLTIKEC